MRKWTEAVSEKIQNGHYEKVLHKKLLSHWNGLPRNVVVASSLSEFKEYPK